MARRRKWRWKEVIPYSACVCFGRKEQWQAIVDEEEDAASPRRRGVSFESQDNHATYVRMLGDVKIHTKPELARDYPRFERRRSSLLQDSDIKILEKLEECPPGSKSRYSPKFSSVRKCRRRVRPVLRVSKENASILDDHYVGQAKCLLSTVGDWDFSVFNLDKLTNGRALFYMCVHIFQEHNLIQTFGLDIVKLMRCISLIEEGYHSSNPYHNAVHAADVTQAMHCYLLENKLGPNLTPLEKMTALLSAITHDLDHPGVNQSFLIATTNPLAGLYDNTSVLENHHWRSAMGVLHESGVFDHFDQHMWNTLEWQLKSLILATDLTRQQEFLPKLKTHLDANDLNLEQLEEHRHFMLQIALKCADICNPCRPWQVSRRWSEQVCDEFFRQGDYEKKLGIPVTPLCDKSGTTVAKIQSGFMQFVVMPLFELWHRFNPSQKSKVMLENLGRNKSQWDQVIKDEEEEAQRAATSESSTETVVTRTVQCTVETAPLDLSDSEEEKENNEPTEIIIEARCDAMSEETDFPSCLPRRHSSPPPVGPKELLLLTARRGSLPMTQNALNAAHQNRRHSLPTSNLYNTASPDKLLLIDKLASLAECSPTNGSRIFEYDFDKPKVTSLSATLNTTVLKEIAVGATHVQTAAHGLDQQLHAQKHLATTDQQVSAIAQRTVSSTRRHSQGLRSQNREPLAATTRDNERRRCSVPVTFQVGCARSAGTTSKCAQRTAVVVQTQTNQLLLPQSTVDHRRMSSPAQIECVASLRDNLALSGGVGVEQRRGSGGYHKTAEHSSHPACLSSDAETRPLLLAEDDTASCSEDHSELSSPNSVSASLIKAAATRCSVLEEETPLLQDEPMRLLQEDLATPTCQSQQQP